MASKHGPLSSAVIELGEITNEYTYFNIPENIRVNKITSKVEKFYKNGQFANKWAEIPQYKTNASGTLRFTVNGYSYGTARMIYLGYHPEDINVKDPILYKDGDHTNVYIDNLYIGHNGESKMRNFGSYDEEWYKLLEQYVPNRADRNCKNKAYMKLLNQRKGPDGLNHCQRFAKKQKDLGLRLRKNKETGKSEWVPV